MPDPHHPTQEPGTDQMFNKVLIEIKWNARHPDKVFMGDEHTGTFLPQLVFSERRPAYTQPRERACLRGELWQGRKSKPGYEEQPIGKDFKYHMEDVN